MVNHKGGIMSKVTETISVTPPEQVLLEDLLQHYFEESTEGCNSPEEIEEQCGVLSLEQIYIAARFAERIGMSSVVPSYLRKE